MKLALVFAVLFASVALLVAEEDDSDDSDETTTVAPAEEPTEAASNAEDESTTEPSQPDTTTKKSKKKGDKKNKKDKKKDKKADKKDMKPANESLILGMYRLASDPKEEDFTDFLKAMEYSKQDRDKVRNAYMIHVSIEKGRKKNEYSYTVFLGFKTTTDKFKLGEEYEAELFDGREYKATVYMSDNVVTREEKHDGFEARHEAKFTRNGFEIELKAKDKTAKQKYDRAGGGGNFFNPIGIDFGGFFG